MPKWIDTDRFSAELRRRGVDLESRRVLITTFGGTKQETDLTLPPNCGGVGRVHHFRTEQGSGWPRNPLPIEPAARFLGLPVSDVAQAQVFQNAVCSWRCWYCFVDFSLLSADPQHSVFLTADDLLDRFLQEPVRPRIIDLSGGQPDLVPEWTLWFTEAMERRGLTSQYFLWSDDNLSNDYLWRFLSKAQLRYLVERPNYARVGCFKGFDENSFSFNTGAEPARFFEQFRLMRRLVDAGFDVYGYATFTGLAQTSVPQAVERFVDRLQDEVDRLFPLRVIPLEIRDFAPMTGRLGFQEHQRALEIQEEAVHAWQCQIAKRFDEATRSRRIWEHQLSGAGA